MILLYCSILTVRPCCTLVINMNDNLDRDSCKWCSEGKIISEEQLDKIHWWDYVDCIVKTNDGRFNLFVTCDDDYYNRYIEINYCPLCGRKLSD